ncbi:hypothetical protein CFP65_1757 [Kitasatospora sp. MMS16-BH015]|uniref:hypothetical protein n=1 Tax=Kitasatospora sp. MMS16-BH015 TaxID=2018025 RepID=UPI000CA392CA|nr:hypothetical protein [Kitasatospora sp. MMS16-BH015]AUG76635.1 hypothetical protein CFP65_1757 [Kitasatospora sp. MMS16-BH015]
MLSVHRAVVLRAATAVLVLGAAFGAEATVGHALARRGVERAERDAYVCSEASRLATVVRADRSQVDGRPALVTLRAAGRCAAAHH